MNFDASGAAYPFPFNTLNNANLELWLKANINSEWDFIWTTSVAGDQNRYNIHTASPNQAGIDYREPNGTIHFLGCSGANTVPAGQWSYLAIVKQGSVYSIYVNSPATSNSTTSNSVQVSPATDNAASGVQGQLSSPASFNYQLSSTNGRVPYSISGIPNWLNASFTTGTVPPTVTDTFSVNACGFGPGTYSSTIPFANTGGGPGTTTRNATVTVNPGTKDDCKGDGKNSPAHRDPSRTRVNASAISRGNREEYAR